MSPLESVYFDSPFDNIEFSFDDCDILIFRFILTIKSIEQIHLMPFGSLNVVILLVLFFISVFWFLI